MVLLVCFLVEGKLIVISLYCNCQRVRTKVVAVEPSEPIVCLGIPAVWTRPKRKLGWLGLGFSSVRDASMTRGGLKLIGRS